MQPAATAVTDDRTSSYVIGFAQITLEGLDPPATVAKAVDDSWVPGRKTTMYKRRWSLSRILSTTPDSWFGKIGFVNSKDVDTLFFDGEENDFVRGQAQSGVVVPFVIFARGIVAYQLIPGVVREQTFIKAISELLNTGNPQLYEWVLTPLTQETEFETWSDAVERVTRFDFRLERPNPHYHGDVIAEELIEGLQAEYVRLSGSEVIGEGIDTTSDAFQQSLDHVLRNYGKVSLTGVDADGSESLWVKLKGFTSRIPARVRFKAAGSVEVSEDALRGAIKELPHAALALRLDEPEESDDETIAG